MKGIVDSVDLSALGLLLCFQISTLSLRPAAPDVHVRRAGKKKHQDISRDPGGKGSFKIRQFKKIKLHMTNMP